MPQTTYRARRVRAFLRGLFWPVAIFAVTAAVALGGCDGDSPSPPAPTPASTDDATDGRANAPTAAACYAVWRAAGSNDSENLRNVEIRNGIVGLAQTAGVDQRVRSAIVDGLYRRNTIPETVTDTMRRYRGVVSACDRAGWKRP